MNAEMHGIIVFHKQWRYHHSSRMLFHVLLENFRCRHRDCIPMHSDNRHVTKSLREGVTSQPLTLLYPPLQFHTIQLGQLSLPSLRGRYMRLCTAVCQKAICSAHSWVVSGPITSLSNTDICLAPTNLVRHITQFGTKSTQLIISSSH